MYRSPKKYFLVLFLCTCYSLLIAQVTTSVIEVTGEQLGKLGEKYSKIETFYEDFQPIKEVLYPIQTVETLADFSVPIPRWSKVKYDYNLTTGDTIQLDVRCFKPKKGKFKLATFTEGANAIRASQIKSNSFVIDQLPIYLTGPHSLEIDNTWKIGKRHCQIKLVRRSEVIPEVYHFVKDTTFLEDSTLNTRIIDTVLTMLIDTTTSVSAVLDLENSSSVSISFNTRNLPLLPRSDTVFSHWVYWLGAGQSTIDAYDELATTIPQGLVPPGISPPLAAHTLGQLTQLPTSSIGDLSVNRKSTNTGNQYEEVFHLINKNTINRYSIRIIAIAVYQVWNSSYVKGQLMRIGSRKVKLD